MPTQDYTSILGSSPKGTERLSEAPSSPVGGLPSWVYDAAHGRDAKSPASCGPRSSLLTLKEVADRLALSTRTVRRLVAHGDLEAVWLGRSVRIAPSSLERIEVGDDAVKLIGNKQVLAAAVTSQNTAPAHVRGFVRKWRTRQDSNL